jgi:hypothetical protein
LLLVLLPLLIFAVAAVFVVVKEVEGASGDTGGSMVISARSPPWKLELVSPSSIS